MTERERLLEKIRKVQALANRGADGEKQSAAALLDRLMTQYGIDEAEIAEERLEKCFFRYKTPYERKLLVQVIYTVTGKIPFKCVGVHSGRARKQVGIDCTAAERLEIEFSYEFYKAALEEEMERFYSAFLMKNDIFPPASKKAEEIPAAEISRSEALKLKRLWRVWATTRAAPYWEAGWNRDRQPTRRPAVSKQGQQRAGPLFRECHKSRLRPLF